MTSVLVNYILKSKSNIFVVYVLAVQNAKQLYMYMFKNTRKSKTLIFGVYVARY